MRITKESNENYKREVMRIMRITRIITRITINENYESNENYKREISD